MADVYVFQHSFQGESGLPRDEMVNTFHIDKSAGAPGAPLEVCNAIRDFYWGIHAPATVTLGSYLSHTINSFDATVKGYRLADPKPRTEVALLDYNPVTMGADPASSEAVPFEVAACLSYAADPVAGVPIGRLRGRIYIGPFNTGALGIDGRPVASLNATMRASGKWLWNTLNGLGWNWGVYSPTRTAAAGGVQQISRIIHVSTDDAWDTQRRRGNNPTARISEIV